MQGEAAAPAAPSYDELLEFYKALVHPVRLKIAGRLAERSCSLSELAKAVSEPVSSLPRHLAVLSAAGLVVTDGSGSYKLDQGWLRRAAAAVPPSARSRALAEAQDERGRVLASFMRDGRITGWPAGDQRKHVLLEEVARHFDAARTYTEREVNAILRPIYDDYTTVRRALVDYLYMNRDRGVYWLGAGRAAAGEHHGTRED